MGKALLTLVCIMALFACNEESKTENETKEVKMNEENITYSFDTVTMNGYIAYDENKEGKRPVVLVVHEWWGQTDYPRMRARELAELGYLAMAVDVYGGGKTTDNPDQAGQLAGPFYQNPQMARNRIEAAMARIKSHPMADSSQVAGIGYCFGGGVLLNCARLGSDFTGVVSFHGSLVGVPPKKDSLVSKILVCHGGADPMVPDSEVSKFKSQMDSINADYTFKVYEGATHAFTNPAATEIGNKYNIPIAYNPKADSASWNDMKDFFSRIFNK